jgi:hypothetical protein
MQSTSTLRRKRSLAASVAASLLSFGAGFAHAYTVDTLLGSDSPANSGDAAVTALLEGFAGLAPGSLTLDYSLNQGDAGFNVTFDALSGAWVIDVAPDTPGYFLLKFGVPGNSSVDNMYFFQNIAEMNALVFTNAQVNNITGGGTCPFLMSTNACNIGRLSHYSVTTSVGSSGGGGSGSGTVPEPASSGLALLGLGMLGLGLRSRKTAAR